MKVQTIQRRINLAFRYLAICGAVLMGVATSAVSAQSPLMNYLSAPGGDQAASSRQMNHEGQAYTVLNASQVRTAADLGGSAGSGQTSIQQTSHPGHSGEAYVPYSGSVGGACGGQCGPACGGQCGSPCGGQCGAYSGCGSCNSHDLYMYGEHWGTCGPHCEPYCYGVVEALYLRREGDRRIFYTGGAFARKDYDFEFAPRITIGALPDCVHGCEATFFGLFEWDRLQREVAINDFLPPVFTAGDALIALNPDAITPFTTNVIARNQLNEAEMWSIEGNKTLVGWDVAKLLFGFRYLEYDEKFRFTSTSRVDTNMDPMAPPVLVDTTGQVYSEVINRLAGLQVGLDLLYPIGRFAYTDFRSRAGLFLNFAEGTVQLTQRTQNDPVFDTIFANFDETTDWAAVLEVGGGVRYQLGEALAARVGVDMLYIPGIGEAPSQIPGVLTPGVGRSVRLSDDVFWWGLSFGGEIRI